MQIKLNNQNCCSEKPVIQLTAGEKLCKNHFNEYFENKVFKTIRQFDLLGKEENLGVALSGGKDSLTVLTILNKLSKQNPKIKLTAIAIDEGIAGYRDKTLVTAQKFCDENRIQLNIFSYKEEFGGDGSDAYEKLLLDIFNGDQMLFNRSDELESSWEFITKILKGWESIESKLLEYEPGTWGPEAAITLIERDGRKWL